MNLTITTCLYDIRKKEQSACKDINTIYDYLELSRPMLRIRLPMVVFTDDEEIVEHVYSTRREYGLLDQTLIIRLPFEQTFFYKDLDMLKQRMEEFHIVNWNQDKDTPLYVLLNNNKFDFLQRSMEINPFQTEFFLWMDMGIQHCTKATEDEWREIAETWPSFIAQDKDHIHQLRIHTVTKPEDMAWKDYFRMIYHHVAGGLFGGYKDRLYEYIHLFQDLWHQILYEEQWWQLDEAIMTILTETHPEKFRFFYGDYDGMLTNFIRTKKSFRLVIQTAERYIGSHQHNVAEPVLNSLEFPYLANTEYFEKALVLKICNDYYLRDGKMSLILSEVLNHHEIPVPILQRQFSNIRHLSDPELVPFLAQWAHRSPTNQWAMERWRMMENQHGGFQWLSLDRFSKSLFHHQQQLSPLPLDDIEWGDPMRLLGYFQSQFLSFPEDHVCALYQVLETPPRNQVCFLWSHPADNHSSDIHEQYDRSVLALYGFLQRNFPQLNAYLICLYSGRMWTIPVEETPPHLLVFCFEMPYSFHEDRDVYHQVASRFVRHLSSHETASP